MTDFNEKDKYFMEVALREAKVACGLGEVPVGAVIVRNGEIIASGHNTRETGKTPLGHAEIAAIESASENIGDWRLDGCTLYVTLEPCPMCAGAIVNARIDRVVFGAKDSSAGAMGSIWCLHKNPVLKSKTEVECGLCEDECKDILRTFFEKIRK